MRSLNRMRTALLFLAIMTLGMRSWAAPVGTQLYVASNGNDRWSGHLAAPNASRTDGPFATPQRAQQEVHALRKGGDREHLTVSLRGGTYYLKTPLILTPDDSGPSAQAITLYAAMPGEKPVLSGGERITGWKPDAQGRIKVSDSVARPRQPQPHKLYAGLGEDNFGWDSLKSSSKYFVGTCVSVMIRKRQGHMGQVNQDIVHTPGVDAQRHCPGPFMVLRDTREPGLQFLEDMVHIPAQGVTTPHRGIREAINLFQGQNAAL